MRILETSSTSEKIIMELSGSEIDMITWALHTFLAETPPLYSRLRDDIQALHECFGCIGTYRAISDIVAEPGEEE